MKQGVVSMSNLNNTPSAVCRVEKSGNRFNAWDTEGVNTFISKFKSIREEYDNCIDGIDIDWEGFCKFQCLETGCKCDWDNACKGSGGMPLNETTKAGAATCWTLPDQTTITVLNKIGKAMRDNGFICTAVPMSTQLYGYNTKKTGDGEPYNVTKETANDQNQYIEYNLDF